MYGSFGFSQLEVLLVDIPRSGKFSPQPLRCRFSHAGSLTDKLPSSRVPLPFPDRRHLHPPSTQPPSVLHGRLGRDAFHWIDRTVNDRKLACYKVDQMGMTEIPKRPHQYS
jgi:hypothetical protein